MPAEQPLPRSKTPQSDQELRSQPESTMPPEEWSDDIIPAEEDTRYLWPETEEDEEHWEEEVLLEWGDDPLDTSKPEPEVEPTAAEAIAWIRPAWRRLSQTWRRLLAGLRRRIPAVAHWSDALLSGVVIGSLVLLLIVLNGLQPPKRVVASPPSSLVLPRMESMNELPMPALQLPPVATDTDRIGDLQAQLTDGTLTLARGIVASVQADFVQNQLTVVMSEGWYRLSRYDQGELANQLLARSRTLSFDDLQLVSQDGALLARKPVVGKAMVIEQFEKPPVVPPPPKPRYRITIDR
jgi:hypothetical protein